jgi:hypothetical protein
VTLVTPSAASTPGSIEARGWVQNSGGSPPRPAPPAIQRFFFRYREFGANADGDDTGEASDLLGDPTVSLGISIAQKKSIKSVICDAA